VSLLNNFGISLKLGGRVNEATSGMIQCGLNSLIILGAWIIWNHWNRCVFDGITPSVSQAQENNVNFGLWQGAKGISFLTAPMARS